MRSTYPKPVLFLWKRDGDVFGGVRFRASHIRRAASATYMGQTHSRMSWQTPQFQPCQHGAAVEHHPAELVSALAAAFADGIRRFVAFAAEHPELNQIMVHEGTTATDRLKWLTETHLKPFFDGIRPAWGGFAKLALPHLSTGSCITCSLARHRCPK